MQWESVADPLTRGGSEPVTLPARSDTVALRASQLDHGFARSDARSADSEARRPRADPAESRSMSGEHGGETGSAAGGDDPRKRRGHSPDQGVDLGVDGRTTTDGPGRKLDPVLTESVPLSPQDRVRGHDHERSPPPGSGSGQSDPEQAVRPAESRSRHRALVDGELPAQGRVLEGELAVAADEEGEEPEEVEQESVTSRESASLTPRYAMSEPGLMSGDDGVHRPLGLGRPTRQSRVSRAPDA